MPHAVQSKSWLVTIALAAAVAAVLAYVWPAWNESPGTDLTRPEIANTAWAAVALWFAAVFAKLLGAAGRAVRDLYVTGLAVFLIHLGTAFHLGHAWSHASAIGHVERESGFGPGLFVSYAFTLVWLADAAWWLAAGRTHRNRSRVWGVLIHGFMAFILFNATVVYGSGVGRWLSAAGFLMAAALLTRSASEG